MRVWLVPIRYVDASMTPDPTDAELDKWERDMEDPRGCPSMEAIISMDLRLIKALRVCRAESKAKDGALEVCLTILRDSDYGEDIGLREAIDQALAALDRETGDA